MEITFSNEEKDGFLIKTAYFEKDTYFFKIPSQYKDEMTDLADPFVILLIFKMMEQGGKFFIKGKVSKSLLDNLELFTSYWIALLPNYYKTVEIITDEEIEDDPKSLTNKAIATFSGGLDASFMLYRHRKGLAGRNNYNIEKAVFIIGFNASLSKKERNEREFNACKNMCDDLGVALIPIETNYRYYPSRFYMEHIACLSATLRLWKDYPYQLIASSEPISTLEIPWGSSPITDYLLSSNCYQVKVDDIDFTRTEKAVLIKNWESAINNLCICGTGSAKALNCGECEKCIRTQLNFRAAGIKKMPSMASDLKKENIKKIKFTESNLRFYHDILDIANKNNIKDDIFIDLKQAIKKHYRKERWKWLPVMRAKILSKITSGKKKEHYIQKAEKLIKNTESTDKYSAWA